MSMVVRTNTMAMNANSALNKNNSTVAGNLQKLSTGFRINRAADDASGLAVSEKMKAQIKALDQAGKNAQDGASLIKTAEGYMGEVHDMLNRIVELAEKSANGTFETVEGGAANETYETAATDRKALQNEVDQLTAEIDRIADTANFNQLKLMNGDLSSKITASDFNAAKAGQSDKKLYVQDSDKLVESNTIDPANTGDAALTEAYDAHGKKVTIGSGEGKDFATVDKAVEAGFAYKTTTVKEASYDADTVDKTTFYNAKGDKVDINGSGGGLKLQIGETSGASDKLQVNVMNFKTDRLFDELAGVKGGNQEILHANAASENTSGKTINISNQDAASKAAEEVRKVINTVSAQRAELGAMENRLDYTMNNLDTASQNITDANSRIRDTDMAKTMMEYTQGNTLTQAAQAMLAQANQAPSQVLQLLQ